MMPKKNRTKSLSSMGIKKLYLLLVLLSIGISCTSIDYQKIELDWSKRQITLLSNSFVIDSIYVERFGKLYYSKSLLNKLEGRQEVSLVNSTDGYLTHVDSLSALKCGEANLGLGIIIRKKGSVIKVTRMIGKGIEHNEEIQTLIGLKYDQCSKGLDTLTTDKFWK